MKSRCPVRHLLFAQDLKKAAIGCSRAEKEITLLWPEMDQTI